VRDERVHTPEEAAGVREGDHVYFLAPPERAQALDRFFVDMPPLLTPDASLIEDFFVPGDATLGALAEIYGLKIPADKGAMRLSDYFAEQFTRPPREGDALRLAPVVLVAHTVLEGRVVMVGLQLAEPERPARTSWQRFKVLARRALRRTRARLLGRP
jgi:cell volume regulation protein A